MRTRRGFTVLEMLVVIGLIVFMFAFMGVMMAKHYENARIKSTQALIEQIATSLAVYEGVYHALPPDTGFGLPAGGNFNYDAGSLYRYLCQSAKIGKALPLKISDENLRDYNDPLHGPGKIIVDAWQNPIGYIGDPRRVIHNRGSADIFSSGSDKKTASDDGVDNGKLFNAANTAYDGAGSDDAAELGEAALNGTLASDLNNWSR